ncbi:hypothetical protein GCK32_002917, partial [Trichostrongylus colubriformis]
SIKDDAQRDFELDRLKAIQQNTDEDHVKRRAKDSHVIERQFEAVPESTAANKSLSYLPSSVDMLVIPPPLPTLAELREIGIISSSDVYKKRQVVEENEKREAPSNHLNTLYGRGGLAEHRAFEGKPLTEQQLKDVADFTAMLDRLQDDKGKLMSFGSKTRLRRDAADLREKEIAGEQGFIPEKEEDFEVHEGSVEDYCNKYEQHFAFYCIGEISDSISTNKAKVISKFCPSYKKACPNKKITKSDGLTAWPRDPFKKRVVVEPPEEGEETDDEEELTSSEEEELKRRDVMIDEIKRRFPCRPECDERLFPHCTHECKCDYSYPYVQSFCNPPPLPFLLNICRIWYRTCPKYEQYHYASQYIYSKAIKGKQFLAASRPQPVNPNPYNIPSPIGVPQIGGEAAPRAFGTELRETRRNSKSRRAVASRNTRFRKRRHRTHNHSHEKFSLVLPPNITEA